ncbi:MAG: peptidoglycan DD-metalloendopeptidase family protein [Sideroxyarcus sp.]|nr:peptidoglycan DD-metalloendopeptidase family protein [Sideroxyarcus sp.]
MMRTLLLAACCLACNTFAADQTDLEKLRHRIATLQQEFDKAAESKAEAADVLRESERAISNSNRALSRLEQQQQEARQTLQRLQRRSDQARTNYRQQQARLGNLLYRQYVSSTEQDYFKLLLGRDEPNQLARNLHYLGHIARERSNTLRAQQAALSELNQATRETEAKQTELGGLRVAERRELTQLQREQVKRQNTLSKISQQLKQQRREIGRLQRNEARLSRLLEELSSVIPEMAGEELSQYKGRLPLPVEGKVSNQFGSRRPKSTLSWTGWFIRATPKQPVQAIAPGRVVYADWLRGFGNLLIVDHGRGFMSLYGNNQTLYKQVGDALRTGDLIAAVGNSGGNEDSGLYFELRYKGQPINPNSWIKH